MKNKAKIQVKITCTAHAVSEPKGRGAELSRNMIGVHSILQILQDPMLPCLQSSQEQ